SGPHSRSTCGVKVRKGQHRRSSVMNSAAMNTVDGSMGKRNAYPSGSSRTSWIAPCKCCATTRCCSLCSVSIAVRSQRNGGSIQCLPHAGSSPASHGLKKGEAGGEMVEDTLVGWDFHDCGTLKALRLQYLQYTGTVQVASVH